MFQAGASAGALAALAVEEGGDLVDVVDAACAAFSISVAARCIFSTAPGGPSALFRRAVVNFAVARGTMSRI
jgi:hypothetical protein